MQIEEGKDMYTLRLLLCKQKVDKIITNLHAKITPQDYTAMLEWMDRGVDIVTCKVRRFVCLEF